MRARMAQAGRAVLRALRRISEWDAEPRRQLGMAENEIVYALFMFVMSYLALTDVVKNLAFGFGVGWTILVIARLNLAYKRIPPPTTTIPNEGGERSANGE